MSDNYAEETKPLFKLLRTEAFRFVIVRYNHFSLVQQLKKDLKNLFPNRPIMKVDAQKLNYHAFSNAYFSLQSGFFFIENFDSLLKEDKDIYGKKTSLMKVENERKRHITAGLNLRRDKLAQYPIALFVFVPASTSTLYAKIIMEKMPDLWSFRSLILDLETTVNGKNDRLKGGELSMGDKIIKPNQNAELNRLLSLLEKTPESEIAYRLTLYPQIVDAAIAVGDYPKALSTLDTWETQGNDNDKGDIWLKRGVVFIEMDYFHDAQTQLENAIGFFKKNQNSFKLALAYEKLGFNYVKIGNLDKSIESYQHAIELNPYSHKALNSIGNVYVDKKEYSKAIEFYQHAIDIKPDKYEAFYNMGIAYENISEYNKAIESYQYAIEIKPDYFEAFNNLGNVCKNKGDYEKAIELYQQAIEIKFDDYESYYNMGIAYKNKGEYAKAIASYQQAIDIKPDNHEALNNMGNVYYEKKEYDKAIEAYQQAIDIKPDKHEAFKNMGNAYYEKGEYNKAIESYEYAIEIKPSYYEAFNSLGFLYLEIRDLVNAEKTLVQSISLGGVDLGNMNLGHVYLCKKEEEKAIQCYKTSFSHFENKSDFWAGMKDDYQYLVQYGITEAYYQSILEKISENTEGVVF